MPYQRGIFLTAFGFLFLAFSFGISANSNADDGPQPRSSAALSHVRVVRLSFVEGTVTVRRPDSTEWTSATVNTPIQEGFSVATDKKSFAEVEFENGSTARLGELSVIDFTQLALSPQGGHINHLTLDDGYATFHVIPQHYDQYLMSASGVNVTPQGKTEFRMDLKEGRFRVEVFSGHVQAANSNQTQILAKNHALVRDADPTAFFQLSDKIEKDDWDKWTDAREQQATLAYNDSAVAPSAPLFGWDDLDVYGEWSYFPGYGNAWTPYEPFGWSPYSTGMWNWYAGMGYTWISAEPWGWLPFHYGFWNFNPGMGWFWMPGSFAAWNPALVNWYSGQGWIGWAPIGPAGIGGRAPCTLAVAGCLTAVPPTTLSNGEPIRPGSPRLRRPGSAEEITAIAHPDIAPARSPISSRESLPRVVNFSGSHNGEPTENGRTRAPNSTLLVSGFSRGREGAPSSVIMGREISPETFMGHHSARGNNFGGREPIRAQLGSTMGGKFPVTNGGATGRSSPGGRDFHGAPGGPQILAHSSNGGHSRAVSGFVPNGGGISQSVASGGVSSNGNSSGAAGGGSRGGGSSSGGSSGSGGGHH